MTEGLTVDLNRLAELHEAATPGPWKANATDDEWECVVDADCYLIAKCEDGTNGYADAELIAAARNALPALLAAAREVEGLRAEVERLRGYIATSDDDFDWSLVTTAEIAAASDDAVAAMRDERDAAVLRADTAERRLTAVHEMHRPRTVDVCMDDDEHQGEPCDCGTKQTVCAGCFDVFADVIGPWTDNPIPVAIIWPCPIVAAAGPVPVTPVTEDQQ